MNIEIEIKEEHREMIREELVYCAELLLENYDLNLARVREILHDLLDVSV